MTHAYDPEAWREVYLMLGGALAALAGLLFVAISVRIEVIGKALHWRTRAFGITLALIGLLLVSALVMMPQTTLWLGIELILANLFLFAVVPLRTWLILARHETAERRPTLRLAVGGAAWLLGAAGGASLIAGAGGGMYLLMLCCFVQIWLCILNAWTFVMVEVPETE